MNAKHTILLALFITACDTQVTPNDYGYGEVAWSENGAAPTTTSETSDTRDGLGWFTAPDPPAAGYTGAWAPEAAWASLPITPGFYTMTPTAVTSTCGGEAEVGSSYEVQVAYDETNAVLKIWRYGIIASGGEGVISASGIREGELPDTTCNVSETMSFSGTITAENTFNGHLTETRTGDAGCDALVDCTNDFEADFVFITPANMDTGVPPLDTAVPPPA